MLSTNELNNSQECQQFLDWYKNADPSDNYVYYRGFLCIEQTTKLQSPIKAMAWEYAVKGRVYLFQRKIADGDYDYIAVKSGVRIKALIPWDYWFERANRVRIKAGGRA